MPTEPAQEPPATTEQSHHNASDSLSRKAVRGSWYPIQILVMTAVLMLRAATSLRATARAIELSEEIYRGEKFAGPSHNTVRNLLQRIGLYEINRAKPYSTQRIWIADHTIQVGHQLCLVVLGIEQAKYQSLQRPLQCEDTEILELLPMEKSNGQIMGEHFVDLAQRYGKPLAILSDEGSDIRGGVDFLNQTRAPDSLPVVHSLDVVHKLSRIIKNLLDKEDRFESYRKQSCASGNCLRQSRLAHLCPPKPKTKARHMNLSPEINWGVKVLQLLDGLDENRNFNEQDRLKARECLGWLEEYRDELTAWSDLMSHCATICSVVRCYGYQDQIVKQTEAALSPPSTPLGGVFVDRAMSFISQQKVRSGCITGSLPGSSEVIESLFGKGKRLEGQQRRSGFTSQLLAMAACVSDLSEASIKEALATVGIKHVRAWVDTMLGPSVQSKRRRDLGSPNRPKVAQSPIPANSKC